MKRSVGRKFFALDLDRTLCDTEAVVDRLETFLLDVRPDLQQALRGDRQAVERSGGSFDVVEGLMRHAGEAVPALIEQFIAHIGQAGSDLWLPGAKELLASIENAEATWGIMTFGGELWQQSKVRLLGVSLARVMVMPERGAKGRVIASWQRQDGTYQLPGMFKAVRVEAVILADDKLSELAGLPQDGSARGYHVYGHAKSPPGLRPAVTPSVVQPVNSLYDIIQFEKDL